MNTHNEQITIGTQPTNVRPVQPCEPKSGQEVAGRYRLEVHLGRGGMGEVWRAHSPTEERYVAIKFMPPVLAATSRRSLSLRSLMQVRSSNRRRRKPPNHK